MHDDKLDGMLTRLADGGYQLTDAQVEHVLDMATEAFVVCDAVPGCLEVKSRQSGVEQWARGIEVGDCGYFSGMSVFVLETAILKPLDRETRGWLLRFADMAASIGKIEFMLEISKIKTRGGR